MSKQLNQWPSLTEINVVCITWATPVCDSEALITVKLVINAVLIFHWCYSIWSATKRVLEQWWKVPSRWGENTCRWTVPSVTSGELRCSQHKIAQREFQERKPSELHRSHDLWATRVFLQREAAATALLRWDTPIFRKPRVNFFNDWVRQCCGINVSTRSHYRCLSRPRSQDRRSQISHLQSVMTWC